MGLQFSMDPWALFPALLLLSMVDCINVLIVCPTPSYSHQLPFIAIGKDLVRRGHLVTMVGTDPLKDPPANFTQIDLSASYKYFKPELKNSELTDALDNQARKTGYEFIDNIERTTNAYTEDQLKSEEMQKFLKLIDEKQIHFDLMIYEGLIHTAYLGFLPKLGYPPLIVMTTINPTCLFRLNSDVLICNPAYLPEIFSGYTNSMTLAQRVDTWLMTLYTSYYVKPRMLRRQDSLMEKYFGTAGLSGERLEAHKSLMFLSTSWLMTYPRPVFPNTVLLGPVHMDDARPLPQDLKDWIEGAEEGVIYFSLGSNMRSASLKEHKRRAIVDSFRQFPAHRVLWKWEEEPRADLPGNVLCRKWFPQIDILAHPNVKLFIMQGGLQSSQEAIHFGVPVLGIPFFADQDYNVRRLESAGVARYLDYEDLAADTLISLMRSVLYNETVYERMRVYSKLSRTQMMSPKDTAYFWIQYVLSANGNMDHLKVNLNTIPWYQYFLIDVLLVLLGGALVAASTLYVMLKIILRLCFKSRNKIKTN